LYCCVLINSNHKLKNRGSIPVTMTKILHVYMIKTCNLILYQNRGTVLFRKMEFPAKYTLKKFRFEYTANCKGTLVDLVANT